MKIHEFALRLPALSVEERAALRADIKEHGVLVPLLVFENQILDGRLRYEIAEELGISYVVKAFNGSRGEALAMVYSLNVLRRHLSIEQRKQLAAELLKENPATSNRSIGQTVSVSDKTVQTVRKLLEATAEIPQLDERVGMDGRTRGHPVKLVYPDPPPSHVPHKIYIPLYRTGNELIAPRLPPKPAPDASAPESLILNRMRRLLTYQLRELAVRLAGEDR